MTRTLITESLTKLVKGFRSKLDDEAIKEIGEFWEEAFAGISDEVIQRGVQAAMLEHKFNSLPTPGQILAWGRGQGLDATLGQSKGEALDPSLWEYALDPGYHRPLQGEANPPPGEVWYHPHVKGLYRNPRLNWKFGGLMSDAQRAMKRDEYLKSDHRH